MKYEYLLDTWGGFYNKEHQHSEKSGYHYFDTKEERTSYLNKLKALEEKLNDRCLLSRINEGYNTRIITTLHRVVKWKGIEYYSSRKISPNHSYDSAKHNLKNKWDLGVKDYPLGEDFDYSNSNLEIIQEWITGAFDISENVP